jgi:16S rRNA pseudouridine516 synthase
MRLDRLLSNLGYGGRRDMAAAVKAGAVSVQGEIIRDESFSVRLSDARNGAVMLDGEVIDPPSPMTIMMNKPAGYVCSREDAAGHLIYDLLPKRWTLRKPALSPIGRLDKDSTGQILLTDDGDLLHRIISPKTNTPKRYRITLRDDVRGDEATLFASGEFMLKGEVKPLRPAHWMADGNRAGIMTLHEGRNRQIRRMFEQLGNDVTGLHRFQTGGLPLSDIPEGEWRILTDAEIASVFSLPA